MVAQLLRLRLDSLGGALRRSASRSVLVVVAALAAFVAAACAAAAVAGVRDDTASTAAALVVPVGALVALGFTLVPFALGEGDQLDPRRFATFGIGRRDLTLGLGVAGLVGVPTVAVAVVAVAQVVAWSRGVGTTLLALLSAVLVVLTCALLARVTATLGAWLFAAHRTRDAGWLVALVVVVLGLPALSLVVMAARHDPVSASVRHAARAAGWTPWGAAWSFPAAAAGGHVGAAVGQLVVALAVVGVLGWAWWALVGTLLEHVDAGRRTRRYRTLGWFDQLPAHPVGAVAARSLTYWSRDPRYRSSYLVLLFVPIVVLPLGVAGMPWHWTALVPLPIMALIAGFLPHNDASYDNTAVWLHVASGAPGWSDRLGRLVPVLVVGVPALVIGAVVSVWLYGDPSLLPVVLGVAGCALLTGLGLSSIASALLPYPAVRPGDHPFRQPQATGALAVTAQSATIVVTVLLTLPAGWFAVRAFRDGPHPWALATLGSGIAIGVVVLVIGVFVGGRLFDRSGPDILAAAQRN
ncbi:ABC transporter permease [Curtobacterium sp. MCBD17_035]|uniref:ABC transporter permease n=1 Tax=Curtobacterium sp. MCBD17_035 TaxID=2175673 RepID=UPI000DA86FB2|nr:ABC transporter permease [Curtobacterium sp. MCBD17_035]WIB66669.1 ABC transporter permease [Curtobacterium sp. MCBD17_035]